ncbi:MAG: peptidoglycan synthetase [Bacteroidales bacterium]|nr:peptidoglycan synthetase [Bacteroidales bacterium]
MKVHFIAIGGAVMHNLAITLRKRGYIVTGSDDEIFEPAKSRLASFGLLPPETGWDPSKITPDLDYVILGMHAGRENPELLKALETDVKIYSFPEFLYEQTKNKKRIVVAGSHGKTTTTAMIMHVFRHLGLKFDYMAGSSVDGFESPVGISEDSTIAVFEGDEYLTSAIDKRPKFLHYKPDIAIINGIAWDHMNVFPTFEEYREQFRLFAETITDGGTLIYFADDSEVKKIAAETGNNIRKIPYRVHGYFQNKTGFYAATICRVVPVKIFGEHNMQNLSAAREACMAAGISEDDFYEAIQSFSGTSRRLQKIFENTNGVAFLDFAHAPSKVKATVEAVASRYPGKKVVACLELHTFSSLNISFLPFYRGTLENADFRFVYFNPGVVKAKNLPPITREMVREAFGQENTEVFDDSAEMISSIKKLNPPNPLYLFMSSGDFDGLDLKTISEELLSD